LSTLLRVSALRRLLREFAPDVVHAHYALDYGTWAALAGVRPLVVTCWGSDLFVAPQRSWVSRWKVRRALRDADVVTADSDDLLECAAALGAAVDGLTKVVFGADTTVFLPGDTSPCPPVILSTRKLAPIYRIGDVILAAAKLKSDGHQFELVVSSSGPLSDELRELATAHGLDDAVRFTGRVDDAELVRLYRGATIYVSVPESDGTSVSLLEAMSCSLPVVASDLAANREWLAEQGDPLVPVGDVPALAAGLVRLLESDEERQRLGRANRAVVESRGDWRSEMNRMQAMYEELAGRSRQ
jgi:glycosyltransferase involved in cell wall biosynthesis